MAKTKNPLFGFDARGTLANLLTFRHRDKQTIAESKPIPKDARTSGQLAWRTMYQLCADLWHTLTDAEKATWETLARRQHMTGYAYYLSQCLRPNPGIYLPLAGGTMSGDINMATKRITNLPAPVADEEPWRKIDAASAISSWTLGKYLLGAGAGVAPTEVSGWQKIAEVVAPSNCDYVDFTSLDINTDKLYLLFTNIKNNTAGALVISLFGNGDYTATNYYMQYIFTIGNSIGYGRVNAAYFTGIGANSSATALVNISKDVDGYLRATILLNREAPSAISWQSQVLASNVVAANITSLRISADVSGGIKAGSTLLLYKTRTS